MLNTEKQEVEKKIPPEDKTVFNFVIRIVRINIVLARVSDQHSKALRKGHVYDNQFSKPLMQ